MMKKQIAILASIIALSSCGTLGELIKVRQAQKEANEALPTEQAKLTRAAVEESNIALINLSLGPDDKIGNYLVAGAVNNGVVTYTRTGRAIAGLRGGLLVMTYSVGNDLINVDRNSSDPIQNQRPISSWPAEINRTYVLPGEGLDNTRLNVNCSYKFGEKAQIEIIEHILNTTRILEHCQGNKLEVTNIYYAADNGFIWKSHQYAGKIPYPLVIEIIEPLD